MPTAKEWAKMMWTAPDKYRGPFGYEKMVGDIRREAAEETAKGLAFAHQLAVEKAERKGAEEMRERFKERIEHRFGPASKTTHEWNLMLDDLPLPGDEK